MDLRVDQPTYDMKSAHWTEHGYEIREPGSPHVSFELATEDEMGNRNYGHETRQVNVVRGKDSMRLQATIG